MSADFDSRKDLNLELKIAVIGWGSLLWDPRELNTRGEWQNDGPSLPLEFARISSRGTEHERLTLVICPEGAICQTFWCYSGLNNISAAIENLRARERCARSSIHFIGNLDSPNSAPEEIVKKWLSQKPEIDAAIWTGLDSNWSELTGQEFNKNTFRAYLEGRLSKGPSVADLIRYFEGAPAQIKTPGREWFDEIRKSLNT